MPEDKNETPEGGVPEPTPRETKGFIGFVPVAEPLPVGTSVDVPSQTATDDPTTPAVPLPPVGPVIIPPPTALCKINLREGCYRITLQPKTGTSIFHGTMRVEKAGSKAVISGDLYRFLNPAIGLPIPVATAASTSVRPAPSSFLPIKLGIPIYARDKYYSYLKVTSIKMPPLLGAPCAFTLTAQEYVYTQPPPGQFNGTFPAAPGTRTINLVLSNAVGPPGYSSVYFEGKVFQGGVEKGTFKMGWVSSFFRKATIEVDTLKGAVAPQAVAAISGLGNEDFKSVFKTAGWDLNVVFDQKDIPVPAGVVATNCWSSPDLHALMVSVRNPTTNLDKEWHFHLIVVPAKMGCSRGIMYDQIGVPREGSASFSDDGYPSSDSAFFGTAQNKKQRDTPRAFLRSASHELGHGFNQIHQEQEGGADNSIMTTTPSVADVLGTATTGDPGVFPTDIHLGFNEHVRHHLTHFPDPTVRPGGISPRARKSAHHRRKKYSCCSQARHIGVFTGPVSWPDLLRPMLCSASRHPRVSLRSPEDGGRGWWNKPRAAYSTTLGTTKKPSCAAGAFLRMSSGMPPSVTSSGRFFIAIGITEVIGSTPSTSTSDNCSTKARMALSSPRRCSTSSSATAMRARCAIRRTVAASTDMGRS